MSQTDLGKVLGCSHVAISKIERGITKLRISDVEHLASALGHTLDYFVSDTLQIVSKNGTVLGLKLTGTLGVWTSFPPHSEVIPRKGARNV